MSEYEPRVNGSDAVPPPAPLPQAETASFPWPPAENDSVINAFGETWKGASVHPRAFFARMPEPGSPGAAVLYYLIIGIITAGAMLFFDLTIGPLDLDNDGILAQLGVAGGDTQPLVEFLLSPIMLLFSLFVSAGVTHLLLLLFAGSKRGYTTTVRVFAYAYSPQLLGIIPYVGSVIGFFWMVVVAIIGLSAAHRITTGRAAFAVLLPLFIAAIFVSLALFLYTAMSVGRT